MKRIYKVLLLFFTALVIAISVVWFFEDRFEQSVWQSEPTSRYKLADDIIESQLLIGKTKAEVLELLGAPSSTSVMKEGSLIYNLGKPASFFEPKMEFLLVVFKNQKVVEVTQLQE